MAVWEFAVVTNDGLNLQAKQATGSTITFTKVKTGGASVSPVLLQKQTDVSDPKQEFLFSDNAYILKEDGAAELSFVFTNKDVNTKYDCWQVGIFAEDPNQGEILYAILQTVNPMTVPAYETDAGWSAEFQVAVQYGNAEQVNVLVDAAGVISRQAADKRYMKKVQYQGAMHEIVIDENGSVWLIETDDPIPGNITEVNSN